MLIAFFKPYGVLSQFTQETENQRTLAEFSFPPHIYPIGRLDQDSEGLLLLSDETPLVNRLLSPKFAHPRTYLSQVERIPSPDALQKLTRGGLEIKGHHCLPCLAHLLNHEPPLPARNPPIRQRREIPTAWLQLTLTEGKNRQVRRMTAAIGFPTLRLIRIAIGKLQLTDLNLTPGEWLELPPHLRKLALP